MTGNLLPLRGVTDGVLLATAADRLEPTAVAAADLAAMVPARLLSCGPFSYPSASTSSQLYLYLGQCYGSGVGGHAAVMPWAGSIVALWAQVNVTAYTSGNIMWRVQKYTPGVGSADVATDAVQTVSGTGTQQFYTKLWTPGDYTFNAGDGLTVRRDLTGGAGAMTTDDLATGLVVRFDDPGM